MTAPVVGVGTLRRLSELDTDGHLVLSVYLNLGPADAQTPAARAAAIEALVSDVGQPAGRADADRVRELLCSTSGFAYGTRGLAAFLSVAGSTCELVPLPCEVKTMAVLDTTPWLEPLVGLARGQHASRTPDRPALAVLMRAGWANPKEGAAAVSKGEKKEEAAVWEEEGMAAVCP